VIRTALRISTGAALLLAAGCGKGPAVPFALEPIAYVDTLPIEPPANRDQDEIERLLGVSVGGQIGHAFSVRRWVGAAHEALNVTRFDDVVNSSWFEKRNGSRRLTVDEVARGPTTTGPDTSRMLTVVAGKAEGISPGFTVRDANGETFLFKFDPKGNLHLASAAGVISNRLFWASGYHTPEDFIVVFDSARLALDPGAEIETVDVERPMKQEDIQTVLSLTDALPDGRFLAIASKFVPGRPIGPFLFSGVRDDDPNDHYYHQYRRELRGLYVVSSWLNHVDMRFANTMDVFIDPPGYVRHYLIDFAATLGSGTIRSHNPREGSEYNFDFWPTMARVFTAGFYKAGWEDQPFTQLHPALGWMPVDEFDPGKWHANWPNEAFKKRTVRDSYWGAKLVGSFTNEQIAAAVSQGQLPEGADEIIAAILAARRDKVVAYWYSKVTPIEHPQASLTTEGDTLILEISFDDLGLESGAFEARETHYTWVFEDQASRTSRSDRRAAQVGPRQTVRLRLADQPEAGRVTPGRDYGTLRIKAVRPGAEGREAVVYLRWDGTDYAVVGLEH
jgi:hypothetical protein